MRALVQRGGCADSLTPPPPPSPYPSRPCLVAFPPFPFPSLRLCDTALDIPFPSLPLCDTALDIPFPSLRLCDTALDIPFPSLRLCDTALDVPFPSLPLCHTALDIHRTARHSSAGRACSSTSSDGGVRNPRSQLVTHSPPTHSPTHAPPPLCRPHALSLPCAPPFPSSPNIRFALLCLCGPLFVWTQVTFEVESAPRLANSSFSVWANFSEPVLPLLPANFTVSGATVRSVLNVVRPPAGSAPVSSAVSEAAASEAAAAAAEAAAGASSVLLLLDGSPGADVSVRLGSGSFVDLANNGGTASEPLALSVPSPGLSAASSALTVASAVSLGASAIVCAATAVFTPGWGAAACAAGLLRSFGHLQLVGMSGGLAADMPAAYREAAASASWSLLRFAPLAFADGLSDTLPALEAAAAAGAPSLPAPLTANTTDELLVSARLLPLGPLYAGTVSSPPAPSNASLVTSGPWVHVTPASQLQPHALLALLNGSAPLREAAPEDHSGALRAAWRGALSAAVIAAAAVLLALAAHAAVALSSDAQLRLAGLKGVYTAFPSLALFAAAAALPAFLYASARLLAWEAALAGEAPVLAVVLLAIAAAAAVGLAAGLLYLTAVWAPRRVLLLPADKLGATAAVPSGGGRSVDAAFAGSQPGDREPLARASASTDVFLPVPPAGSAPGGIGGGSPLHRAVFERRASGLSAGARAGGAMVVQPLA
eukprot:320224-Chlamydomonas_euryale.AAC.1